MASETDLIRSFIEDGRNRWTFGSDGKSHEERFGTGEAFDLILRNRAATPELGEYCDRLLAGINQSLGETDKRDPKVPTASKVTIEWGLHRDLLGALGLAFEAADVPSEDKILAGQYRSQLK